MSHSHSHSHGPSHGHAHGRESSRRRLAWTLGLVLLYMTAEVVGGLFTHSLALLADAGHMLSDAASLGLALWALRMAQRPRTLDRTFGLHRAEILAAMANGVTLVVIAGFIVVEAWERFQAPEDVAGREMMWIAVGGLVVNLVGMKILHGSRDESLNLRGAWLHVLADTLGSVQAIAAGALIWAFGWMWADPLASVLIAALVLLSAVPLLRDSLRVLLEASPGHLDMGEVREALLAVDGVEGVHDLHAWTITSGFESLTAHVEVDDADRDAVLDEIETMLRNRFDVEHSTIQVEGGERAASCDTC